MKYIIFGSGGFAKEVINYLDPIDEVVCVVSTLPFDDPDNYPFLVKEKLEYDQYPGAKFLMCVADPVLKRKFVSENEDKWVSFVHKTATVSPNAKIGKGVIICPNTVVTSNAVVGNFVTLNLNCCVAHDCTVGDYTTFSPYAGIMGYCNIGEDCFFGTNGICVPGVKLPSGTKVSAGAVVRKSIQEPATLYGDPAKPRQ